MVQYSNFCGVIEARRDHFKNGTTSKSQISIDFSLKYKSLFIIALTVLLFSKAYAQDTTTTNFYDQIKNYDLSTILMADSLLTEDREDYKEKIKRKEILGFIGNDYQRFYIHFISIIQNPTNSYEYLVYGKTKVKETICSFQGTITVRQACIYRSADIPAYKEGFATCDVILYEDKKQNSSGFFQGKLTSNYIIDNKGQFRYDALVFESDRFSNNQFVGTWTSYKTNATKKCNWGDYRIPESRGFDVGSGDFGVKDMYVKNGWENYQLAWNTYPTTPEVEKARQKEKEQWWK